MSAGQIFIEGLDLRKEMTAVRRKIGYCPQYNGLIDLMTGLETLRFFARLRGVKESAVESTAQRLVRELDLSKHAHKLSGTYSGGNKRKLSTAIALVGDPPIVFLDEPTTVSVLSFALLSSSPSSPCYTTSLGALTVHASG